MDGEGIRSLLASSLADGHFSRRERSRLRDAIEDTELTDELCKEIRQEAFELVRGQWDHPALAWLEDVIDVTRRAGSEAATARAPEVLFSPRDDCPGRIRGLIRGASVRLDICVFTITDDRITEEIIAAAQRGVGVRVISDDEKAHDRGSDVRRLIDLGIPVALDREGHMHHKFALFDPPVSLTGSYNWTRGAAHHNRENILISHDPRIAGRLAEEFEELWRRHA